MFFTLTLLLIDSPLVYEEVKEHELTLSAGRYKIECFGAQGGSASYKNENTNQGGKGAYVYDTINICGNGTIFYLFVGGKGEQYPKGEHDFPGYNAGGFNGGGNSGHESGSGLGDCSGGGGGATDIRTIRDDINSRIIVAAGGSGGVGEHDGAPGGDIKGKYYPQNYVLANSTETDNINGNADGKGGNGKDSSTIPRSGGGGGWRGGVSTNDFPYFGFEFLCRYCT